MPPLLLLLLLSVSLSSSSSATTIPSMRFRPDPTASPKDNYFPLANNSAVRDGVGPDDTVANVTICYRFNPDYLRKIPAIGVKGVFHYIPSWNDEEDTVDILLLFHIFCSLRNLTY